MVRWYSSMFLAVILGAVAAGPASAQTGGTNVAFGYSFLRLLDDADENLPLGWLVSFATPVRSTPVALVGEIAGNYRRTDDITFRLHTAQGGVRIFGDTDGGVTPFAQVLAGVMAYGCCGGSSRAFSLEPGGGVDVAVGRSVALRLAASLPIAFSDGDTAHGLRLQAGLVLPLTVR
jgi:hypothetical protein